MPFGDHTELPGEVGLLVRRQLLVTEEDDVVGVESGPDLGHHRVPKGAGQVEPVYLRPDER